MTRYLLLLLALPAFADPVIESGGKCYTQVQPLWVCWTGGGAPDMKPLPDAAAECEQYEGRLAAAVNVWVETACPDKMPPDKPAGIQWTPSALNTDGTEADDIAGFVVYCNEHEWRVDDPAVHELRWPEPISLPITCDVASVDEAGNVGPRSMQIRRGR